MPGEIHPKATGAAGLTRRELEVVRLVSEGLSGPEVAKRICRSPRTIEKHLASAYQKLAVRNRVELVHKAQEHGLLESRTPGAREQVRGRALDILEAIDKRLASFENHLYFAELVLTVAEAFGVRWAGLSEAPPNTDNIEIIAFVADGNLVDQVSCPRSISPCAEVFEKGSLLIPDRFAQLYPVAPHTIAYPGIRAYAGVRLDDRILGPVGTLWIMDDKPLDPATEPLLVLRLLARRAAPELALARTLDALGSETPNRIDPNLN